MRVIIRISLILIFTVMCLVSSVVGVEVMGGQATVTLDLPSPPTPGGSGVISRFVITADDAVKTLGYSVNGIDGCEELSISGSENTTISIRNNPLGVSDKKVVLINAGNSFDFIDNLFVITISKHSTAVVIRVHLAMADKPVTPSGGGGGYGPVPVPPELPIEPEIPDIPDTPSDPEHPDTPGSDEPLVPILPPADSVYNFAGFIPLLAGFFLLFLLVAFRGNLVYRILKKHAKRHGEKPDKEEKKQLKATASAIILLIRDEERYGEWRKNREMEMRLTADIISVLDEMQYPPQIPRGAAAAEILKAAKGRINRHRL